MAPLARLAPQWMTREQMSETSQRVSRLWMIKSDPVFCGLAYRAYSPYKGVPRLRKARSVVIFSSTHKYI